MLKFSKHLCLSRYAWYSCDTSGRVNHHVNKPGTQEHNKCIVVVLMSINCWNVNGVEVWVVNYGSVSWLQAVIAHDIVQNTSSTALKQLELELQNFNDHTKFFHQQAFDLFYVFSVVVYISDDSEDTGKLEDVDEGEDKDGAASWHGCRILGLCNVERCHKGDFKGGLQIFFFYKAKTNTATEGNWGKTTSWQLNSYLFPENLIYITKRCSTTNPCSQVTI